MKVQDLMTTSVKSCRPDTNLAAVAMIMWENDCGVAPVLNAQGHVIGMITDRDICMAVATKHRLASQISVNEVMARSVQTCAPGDDVQSALKTMREKQLHRLPVVNAAGQLVGLLSLNDLILKAEEARGKATPDLSYENIFGTLKGISAHRVPKAATPPQSAQAAAVA